MQETGLHIAASHKDLEAFFKANGKRKDKIKKSLFVEPEELVTILHFSLAPFGMQIKIIEQNRQKM